MPKSPKRSPKKSSKSPKRHNKNKNKNKCDCDSIANIRNFDVLYEKFVIAAGMGQFCTVYKIMNKQCYAWLPQHVLDKALQLASQYGRENVVKLLLLNNANPTADNNSALNVALINKKYNIFYEMISMISQDKNKLYRIDLNELLPRVVMDGNLDLVDKMLKMQRFASSHINLAIEAAKVFHKNDIVKRLEKEK